MISSSVTKNRNKISSSMSQGEEVTSEYRNAYVNFKEGQNELKAQHHDDTSQTLRLVRIGLFLGVVFALVALSIYAFEKLGDKSEKLVKRSAEYYFYQTATFELAADEGFNHSVKKLCSYLDKKGEDRSKYAQKARELGALLTAQRLEVGRSGDCENLADSK